MCWRWTPTASIEAYVGVEFFAPTINPDTAFCPPEPRSNAPPHLRATPPQARIQYRRCTRREVIGAYICKSSLGSVTRAACASLAKGCLVRSRPRSTRQPRARSMPRADHVGTLAASEMAATASPLPEGLPTSPVHARRVGGGGCAQPEKLVLGVLGDDARIASAVKSILRARVGCPPHAALRCRRCAAERALARRWRDQRPWWQRRRRVLCSHIAMHERHAGAPVRPRDWARDSASDSASRSELAKTRQIPWHGKARHGGLAHAGLGCNLGNDPCTTSCARREHQPRHRPARRAEQCICAAMQFSRGVTFGHGWIAPAGLGFKGGIVYVFLHSCLGRNDGKKNNLHTFCRKSTISVIPASGPRNAPDPQDLSLQRIVSTAQPAARPIWRALSPHAKRPANASLRGGMSCTNLARTRSPLNPQNAKLKLHALKAPNLGIVSAVQRHTLGAPAASRAFLSWSNKPALEVGATAQFAGGVPAILRWRNLWTGGMELCLFSRDVIAMSTAIALSHNVFDAGALPWRMRQDRTWFAYRCAGLGTSGDLRPCRANDHRIVQRRKAKIRQHMPKENSTAPHSLEAESRAYHGPGTCTFMARPAATSCSWKSWVCMPGAPFVPPVRLCAMLTRATAQRAAGITHLGNDYLPLRKWSTKSASSTPSLACLPRAVPPITPFISSPWRAPGIIVDWDDFDRLSSAVPLLSRACTRTAAPT